MNEDDVDQDHLRLAEAIRTACLEAALESYEEASMRGLYHEGAWGCAIGAIRTLNLRLLLTQTEE
jgi:hypothetical protein